MDAKKEEDQEIEIKIQNWILIELAHLKYAIQSLKIIENHYWD